MARFWPMLGSAAIVVLADRLTKWWVVREFYLGESRPLAPFFHLTYVHNTGTAFGLFQGNNAALTVLAALILAALLWGARGLSERCGWAGVYGVGLVAGGALGNIIDRLHYGVVIDFLDFRVWPVFNVADSAITVGACLLAFGLWRAED